MSAEHTRARGPNCPGLVSSAPPALCRSVTPDAAGAVHRGLFFPRCCESGGGRQDYRVSQDQHLSTLTAEQRRRGLSRLRFSRYVEEQFRLRYAAINQPKVRPLLVSAALAVVATTIFGMSQQSISVVTATFGPNLRLKWFFTSR